MELKFARRFSALIASVGSNRTFMELKSQHDRRLSLMQEGSNRTFMELKCGKRDA